MECPTCHEAAGGGLICQACGGVLPPRRVDGFAALGVPRRWHLDATELERRYRELSKKLHPDRFAKGDAKQRQWSLQATTTLNEAYRSLKQPVARAEHLLEVEGAGIAENERIDGAFLGDMMQLRESLEEAQEAGDQKELDRLAAEGTRLVRACLEQIDAGFDVWETQPSRDVLEKIKRQLIVMRYLRRFVDAQQGDEDV